MCSLWNNSDTNVVLVTLRPELQDLSDQFWIRYSRVLGISGPVTTDHVRDHTYLPHVVINNLEPQLSVTVSSITCDGHGRIAISIREDHE